MSSLTIDKSGKTIGYNIQWCEDGRRYTIYLGGRRYNKKTAEACQECIDALLYYQRNNIITPDRKIEDWLQSAPVHLRSKLAKAGLIPASKSKTWRELWDSFLVDRQHAKPATLCKYRSCQKLFYKAFSPTECIADITSDSLLNWKHSLLQRCKPGGVETRLAIIDTILNWAIGRDWLSTNPMEKVPRERVINREKHRTISREEYAKLLDASPTQEWRTIIALARIGGLRCPSELQQLRWSDIKWERRRFMVHSPKTEHHAGHHEREVPLFPELREELQRLFEHVKPEVNDFVIQSFQGKDRWSLAGPFARISKAAGLGIIAQPFLNTRRSRSNEVVRDFVPTKESLWIGHSIKVMQDHYYCPTDKDFVEAAGLSLEGPMPLQKSLQ